MKNFVHLATTETTQHLVLFDTMLLHSEHKQRRPLTKTSQRCDTSARHASAAGDGVLGGEAPPCMTNAFRRGAKERGGRIKNTLFGLVRFLFNFSETLDKLIGILPL